MDDFSFRPHGPLSPEQALGRTRTQGAQTAIRAPELTLGAGKPTLGVVCASLALGGAERLASDWANQMARQGYPVVFCALFDQEQEFPLDPRIELIRLSGKDILGGLRALGERARSSATLWHLHLLSPKRTRAFFEGGARGLVFFHNDEEGWFGKPGDFEHPNLAGFCAISEDCRQKMIKAGARSKIHTLRFGASAPAQAYDPTERSFWRERLGLEEHEKAICAMGSLKRQKGYARLLLSFRIALDLGFPGKLFIIGGKAHGAANALEFDRVFSEIARLGLSRHARILGWQPNPWGILGAMDIGANSSFHEGLSIATQEMLASGLAVCAADGPGAREILAPPGRLILSANEPFSPSDFANALISAPARWIGEEAKNGASLFKKRLFCANEALKLMCLAPPPTPQAPDCAFATSNLNAGGAQRSLVNLLLAHKRIGAGSFKPWLALFHPSTQSDFLAALLSENVETTQIAIEEDAFSIAEGLLLALREKPSSFLCFWSADARAKLLLGKALGASGFPFMDISPGHYASLEIAKEREFFDLISYSQEDFQRDCGAFGFKHGRLDQEPIPDLIRTKRIVIPNGVFLPRRQKTQWRARESSPWRLAMSGRITESKLLHEAFGAFEALLKEHPQAELHVFGSHEPSREAFAQALFSRFEKLLGKSLFLHGPRPDTPELMALFDAFLVLGVHQGCPNALLEALAAGLPSAANDSGGASEQLIHGKTGALLPEHPTVADIQKALCFLLEHPGESRRMGEAGRARIARLFSIPLFCERHAALWRRARAGFRACSPWDRLLSFMR